MRKTSNIKSKYKKALVTGGAGFIGSHLVEALLKQGLKVVSIDNYISGKKENLKNFLNNPNFQEVNCNIVDYDSLKKYFDGIDIVFHEAALKKTVCLDNPRKDLDINAKGSFNVLELARDFGVKKVVHASTGSVYGEAIYYPQDEKHPVKPTSYYGVSKLAAEKYAMVFSHLFDMDITVLRYFHVYGPRQPYSEIGGVVSIFGSRVLKGESPTIYGDGSQERSFTYVKDIVDINFLVAELDKTKGEAYNCASGIRMTINELASKIKKVLGKDDLETIYDDWKPGDIKKFIVDNSKLKELGFEFKASFEEGLEKTLAWLKNELNGEKSDA